MNKPFIKRKSIESVEQIKFVQYVRTFHPDLVIFSVPNGGDVSATQRIRLTQEGMLAGMPDVLVLGLNLPVLAIEFKRPDGKGRVSAEQQELHVQMEGVGAIVRVATSSEQGREYLTEWLQGQHNATHEHS